jgi:hypothetical protein
MSRRCDPCDSAIRVRSVAQTLTTLAIALGATIVLALAGCAGSAPGATPVDPAKVGVAAGAARAVGAH